MKESLTAFGKRKYLFYWIITAAVGWSLKVVDFGLIEQWTVRSMTELPAIILFSAFSGLISGLVLGIGQQAIIHHLSTEKKHDWWWKTVIGCSLLAPAGIGIITLITWIGISIRGDIFLPDNQSMGISLYPGYLFYGGIILGIMQWSGLRNIIGKRGWKEALLWILGIWTSFGLGIISGLITADIVSRPVTQSTWNYFLEITVTGIVYGVVSGAILLIFLNESTNHTDAIE